MACPPGSIFRPFFHSTEPGLPKREQVASHFSRRGKYQMSCQRRFVLAVLLVAFGCGDMEPEEPLLTLDEATALYDASHHETLLEDTTAVVSVSETDSGREVLVACSHGGQALVVITESFWERADTLFARGVYQSTYMDCKVTAEDSARIAGDVEFLVTGPGLGAQLDLAIIGGDSLVATALVTGTLDWAIESEARSGRCEVDVKGEGRWDISDLPNITGEGVLGGLLCGHAIEMEWASIVVVVTVGGAHHLSTR